MNNKKKLLIGSLSTAAVVAGVAMTGGTSAYYYDLERSEGNRLSACSIDLEEQDVRITQTQSGDETDLAHSQADVNSSTSSGGLSTITLDNLVPGDIFKVEIDLKNVGSCSGEMWGDVNFPIVDDENTKLEAEQEPGVPDPDPSGGDLDDVLLATYQGPNDDSVSYTGTYHNLAYLPPWLLDSDFTGGEMNTVTILLEVPDEGTARDGNEVMSDKFTFAIDFAAAQKNKINPRPGGSGRDLNNPSTLNNS